MQLAGKNCALIHDIAFAKSEFAHASQRLFTGEQIALFGQLLSRLLIALQGSGHLLVVHPLVPDELQLVVSFGRLQILVGRLDETGGKLILLLQGRVGQRSVDGVLGQVGTGLTGQGSFQIGTRRCDLRTSILHHLARGVHIFKDIGERGNIASHLVGHVHQRCELKGARLHDHIDSGHVVLEVLVIRDQLLHIGKALRSSLAGETGRLGDVAAGVVYVNRPVDQGRNNETDCAGENDRGQNDNTFLAFHDFMIFVLLKFLLQR